MKIETIVIKWHGPYTMQEVKDSGSGNGLYLLTGRLKYQRDDQIQYCGITEGLFCKRLSPRHPVLADITKNLSVWFGEIAYPCKFSRRHLELAEHCIIHFLWPPCNKSKLHKSPLPAWIISEWFNPKGEARVNRLATYRDLPEVLWWNDECWKTANLKVAWRAE
jgi:hypothetical protein